MNGMDIEREDPLEGVGVMQNVDLRGTGSFFFDGAQVLARVRYLVQVRQRGVMGQITGRIEVDPHGDGARLISLNIGPNSDFVLVLEDGRRWHCVLKNNSGDLLNGGGFEEPAGKVGG
jgi:hypothetical protein